MCLGELREKVARGGDPTKWRESPIVNDDDDDDINNENGTFYYSPLLKDTHYHYFYNLFGYNRMYVIYCVRVW